jgi:hypothetical protein
VSRDLRAVLRAAARSASAGPDFDRIRRRGRVLLATRVLSVVAVLGLLGGAAAGAVLRLVDGPSVVIGPGPGLEPAAPTPEAMGGEEPELLSCEESAGGAWRTTAAPPIPLAEGLQTVMMGDEVVLLGGRSDVGDVSGGAVAAYAPASDRWRRLADHPLEAETGFAAAWTGAELLVWGGTWYGDHVAPTFAEGTAYDPATDTWRPLPALPHGPLATEAYWTGTEVLVVGGTVGGDGGGAPSPFGAAFDPATETWRILPDPPLDVPDHLLRDNVVTWVGSQLVVLAPNDPVIERVHGAAYDPDTDRWQRITPGAVDSWPPVAPVATDDEVVFWRQDYTQRREGGVTVMHQAGVGSGVAYNPQTDTWRTVGAPHPAHSGGSALWTGEVILMVGTWIASEEDWQPYDPAVLEIDIATATCRALPLSPSQDLPAAVIWTGQELLVLPTHGGRAGDEALAAVWRPDR